MILVDVLLAANLAVLVVLVVADRSKQHRMRPADVLEASRPGRRAATAPAHAAGVVIPFDRAYRRSLDGAVRHPASGDGSPRR